MLNRRRALMGAQGGGGSSAILWEWTPADGLSPLNIAGKTTTATIVGNALHIKMAAAMGFGMLSPTESITWPDKYKIEVEFSDIGGTNINLYITTRFDSGRNNYVALRKNDSIVRVTGVAQNNTSLSPFPSSATVSLTIDKTAEQITAEVNGITYGPYDIATGTSATAYLIGFEGQTTSHYVDIAHILIEDLT